MEAVAALSLGRNVLQLLGDAIKVGEFVYEVYENGKIPGKDQLRESAARLTELSRVSTRLAIQQSSKSSLSPGDQDREELSKILLTCAKDAGTLHKELKAFETSAQGWQRLKFGLKAAVKDMPSKFREIRDRMDENRQWLDSAMFRILALDVQHPISQQEIVLNSLVTASKECLRQIDAGFASLEAAQQKSEATLKSYIDQGFILQADEQDRLRLQHYPAQRLEQSRIKLLESLEYNGMYERVNSLTRGERGTFDWILDRQTDRLTHNFATWLTDDKPVYWIQGQAGSGKSTLMKRIWDDKQLQVLLARDGCSLPSFVLKHSFWLPSKDKMRKSYKGMLCSIIHSLLLNNSPAIDRVLGKDVNLTSFQTYGDWSEDTLEDTLFDLLANCDNIGCKCIFVDALDEIESRIDHRRLIRFIDKLSDFEKYLTKICVSSRPERPWTENFRDKPQLRLQDITKADIKAYAMGALSGVLPSDQSEPGHTSCGDFLEEFVEKSEGVFLWAYLAVVALLGSTTHASWEEIYGLLRKLPTEMEDLYDQILAKRANDVDDVKAEAATYILLCLETFYGSGFYSRSSEGFALHQALPIWKAHFRKDLEYHRLCDREAFLKDYQRLEDRILDICAGLLTPKYRIHTVGDLIRTSEFLALNSLNERPQSLSEHDICSVCFVFAHRTAADFFFDTPRGRHFIQRCPLSPINILTVHIDAEMMQCRLWYEYSLYYRWSGMRYLAYTIQRVCNLARKHPETATDMSICRAIRRIKDALTDLPDSCSADIETELLDAAAIQVFAFAKRDVFQHWTTPHYIACDIDGLLLELGEDAWFKSQLQGLVESGGAGSLSLKATYKDYLLICAVRGNLSKIAGLLVRSGADLYAEHYLPVCHPRKTSAAGQLLTVLSGSRLTPIYVTAWADLLGSCPPKTQYLVFNHFWHREPKPSLKYGSEGWFHTLGDPVEDPDAITHILDVNTHLNLWSQHAINAQDRDLELKADDCLGFTLLTDLKSSKVLIQPLFARSWRGFVHRRREWQKNTFPGVLPFYCCRCLAEEGDGLWTLLPAIAGFEIGHSGCQHDERGSAQPVDNEMPRRDNSKMGFASPFVGASQLGDQPNWTKEEQRFMKIELMPTATYEEQASRRRKMTRALKELLIERDFLRHPSDPRVLQKPLCMFESAVETGDSVS